MLRTLPPCYQKRMQNGGIQGKAGLAPDVLQRRFLAGCAAARAAGALAHRHFLNRAGLTVERKGLQDPVSEADRAAETLIRESLSRAFPGDAFLGEEGGGTSAERLWVIDPIDGTANFVHGLPGFCVSLAYVESDVTQIGIVYAPVTDELFAACRGGGASCNGTPIRVSGCTRPDEALIGLSFSHKGTREQFIAALDRMLADGSEFRRIGSTTLGLAYVAAGRLDGFWTPRTQSWDVLAGLLLIQEAGGWANDFLAEHGALAPGDALGCTPGLQSWLSGQVGR